MKSETGHAGTRKARLGKDTPGGSTCLQGKEFFKRYLTAGSYIPVPAWPWSGPSLSLGAPGLRLKVISVNPVLAGDVKRVRRSEIELNSRNYALPPKANKKEGLPSPVKDLSNPPVTDS